MTVTIDPNTGLPELPGTQRWTIRPLQVPSSGYTAFGPTFYNHPDKLELVLETSAGAIKTSLLGADGLLRAPSGQLHRLSDVNELSRVERKSFIGSLRVTEISFTTWTPVLTAEIKGHNPIGIRNAANNILKRHQKDDLRKSLIGSYPPKKLETV